MIMNCIVFRLLYYSDLITSQITLSNYGVGIINQSINLLYFELIEN